MMYFNGSLRSNGCIHMNNAATGFLHITVFHNVVNTVIENAVVSIYKISYHGTYNERAEGRFIAQYTTDKDGATPLIELPVLNELMPGNKDYYYISVSAYGFNDAFIFNVQIYPNILSSYKMYLTHTFYDDVVFNFIVEPTRTEIHRRNIN
ncbi:MAG: hypothetical protein AAGU76_01870 [Sedimentibacter sp.]|uniref:hypothetical protein n=1 Tax=Sedimentibacter sp. TaxID=1960295 RepID=UPI0031580CDA